MERIHPTLKIYDELAFKYDRQASVMESLFSKGRTIFTCLRGNILEVGVGTGINLQYYHNSTNVIAIDWSPRMVYLAKSKVRKKGLAHVKKIIVADIIKLSTYFNPHAFNFVTSTCVFCSVPDPIRGFREIAKLLKSSGFLIQIEHGSSDSRMLNLIIRMFDPLTAKLHGFHLTRNTVKNLEIAGFNVILGLKLLVFLFPAIAIAGSLICLYLYPFSKTKVEEMKAQLKEMHEKKMDKVKS